MRSDQECKDVWGCACCSQRSASETETRERNCFWTIEVEVMRLAASGRSRADATSNCGSYAMNESSRDEWCDGREPKPVESRRQRGHRCKSPKGRGDSVNPRTSRVAVLCAELHSVLCCAALCCTESGPRNCACVLVERRPSTEPRKRDKGVLPQFPIHLSSTSCTRPVLRGHSAPRSSFLLPMRLYAFCKSTLLACCTNPFVTSNLHSYKAVELVYSRHTFESIKASHSKSLVLLFYLGSVPKKRGREPFDPVLCSCLLATPRRAFQIFSCWGRSQHCRFPSKLRLLQHTRGAAERQAYQESSSDCRAAFPRSLASGRKSYSHQLWCSSPFGMSLGTVNNIWRHTHTRRARTNTPLTPCLDFGMLFWI